MNKAEELNKQITKILWRGLDAYDAATVSHLITQYAQQVKREAVNELFEAFGNFCKAINEQNQKL